MIEKPWGSWKLLFIDDVYELRLLHLKAGGFCSRHYHETKCNVFHVVSGSIRVKTYGASEPGEDGLLLVRILTRGSGPYHIPAGTQHRFEVIQDAIAYESSMARTGETIDINEIHRLDESGFREPERDQ